MKTSVDLYPEEYYAYVAIRRRLVLWSGLFCVVIVTISIASLSLWRKVHNAEFDLTLLETQVQGMELWGAQLAPLVSDLDSARERQRVLGQLVNEPAWSALLDDMGSATGDRVWLRDFSVETDTQTDANGEPELVRSIAIFGYAETADDFVDFMAALSESSNVRGVDQKYSRKSNEFEDNDILEFQLQAELI